MAEVKRGEPGPSGVPFDPAAWAREHLDLLHQPDYQASIALRELGIPELEVVYQMLRRNYFFSDWPRFVWETFSSTLEVEMTA